MKPVTRVLLLVLALVFVVPLLTVDKFVTEGNHTIHRGETYRGGLVMTSGDVTIEEGARLEGGVFKSSGVLTVNGEVGGGIFSSSGDVRLGPHAVVGGHVTVQSVPFEPAPGARIDDNVVADIASWLGGPFGAAIKLLIVAGIVLFLPGLLALRPIPGTANREPAPLAKGSGAVALGGLLVAFGVLVLVRVTGATLSPVVWVAATIVPGLLLFVAMVTRGRPDGSLALPASVLTITGLVLGYQALTGRWESWAYAWALVLPMSIGVGQVIAGWWNRDRRLERVGLQVAGVGLALFVAGALLLEGIAGANGRVAALVAGGLLVGAGVYVLLGRGPRPSSSAHA